MKKIVNYLSKYSRTFILVVLMTIILNAVFMVIEILLLRPVIFFCNRTSRGILSLLNFADN